MTFYNPYITSNLYHRPNRLPSSNPSFHNFFLQLRRFRRLCRPFTPILFRAIIVLFTAIGLRPTAAHLTSALLPTLSRFAVLCGLLSSLLSLIFFDVRLFNYALLLAVFLVFVVDVRQHNHIPLPTLLANLCFHSTAILFSTLVGRRRSICKPSALRHNAASKHYYMYALRTLRNVDVLEAGTRLQACILALDYSLAHTHATSPFFITLPFAFLFLIGYATQRNGIALLLLLLAFSLINQTSSFLAFNFTKTATTVGATALALSVGPGMLTVDEWLATTHQLCY